MSLSGDGSLSPLVSDVANLTKATVGLTYQARNGFFVGYGVNYSWPTVDVVDDPEQRREQELLGPAGADRLSPGRARLCAAAAAPAAAPAAAAPAAAAATARRCTS